MRDLELALVASLLCCALFIWRRSSPSALPLPPGPKINWFGSVSNIPKVRPWLIYGGPWKETFGDLIYIQIFGNPILVVNSATAAADLLEKRGAKYSSRPVRTMVVDLIGWDWLASSFPYGSKWQKHRIMFHRHLPANESSTKYHPLQIQEARILCRRLLDSPVDFRHHVRNAAATIVLRMAYGQSVDTNDYVPLADKALSSLAQAGIFGTFLVDYIPILKYAPSWFTFKRKALEWRIPTRAMRDLPFAKVKEHIAQGKGSDCIVSQELEKLSCDSGSKEGENTVANVSATMFAAGADTVVSTLSACFLVMSLYPDIQAKAQADLDAVLAQRRLPNFNDRSQLPFIDYICYELLCAKIAYCSASFSLNFVQTMATSDAPWACTLYLRSEEDEYRGFRIPKGTTANQVLPNVWSILHDPETYPDPLTFNPWRFENTSNGLNPFPDPAFGFGRRFCPGKHLAFDTLWIVVASTLAVFSITKETDANGQIKEPTTEFTPHLLSHPLPFGCTITPRSSNARELILESDL
ncbi:Cytochrome P450 [Mycena indigotica]|uniref:Cytochrome P450 n=1 Tax=Mycena indigotica TaxID=2126181 RepID=A0A8H6W6U3_9AGAR|nr:Cytochrome P450 [Mycena indigotica]KAF7306992.1 Cytochrome P450 [Mycena indigotica]